MKRMQVMSMLYEGIEQALGEAGYKPEYQKDAKQSGCPAYERGEEAVMDFMGKNNLARLVFSKDRIHLLFADKGADKSDDSAFTRDSTYLFDLAEYGENDVKSLINEMNDYLNESFVTKKKNVKVKAPRTVSRTAVRSGMSAYDSITLATKISGMYPELKDEITKNIADYGEFLCEDFFVNHANAFIMDTIKENRPQKMKRLFNILGEIYEDGTNEVQSLIAVTILGPIKNDPIIIQQIMPYLTDAMLEPILAVSEKLQKSKTARLRLENPPEYKPPKKKKSYIQRAMDSADLQQ